MWNWRDMSCPGISPTSFMFDDDVVWHKLCLIDYQLRTTRWHVHVWYTDTNCVLYYTNNEEFVLYVACFCLNQAAWPTCWMSHLKCWPDLMNFDYQNKSYNHCRIKETFKWDSCIVNIIFQKTQNLLNSVIYFVLHLKMHKPYHRYLLRFSLRIIWNNSQ